MEQEGGMASKKRMEGDRVLISFECLLRSLFFVDCVMSTGKHES